MRGSCPGEHSKRDGGVRGQYVNRAADNAGAGMGPPLAVSKPSGSGKLRLFVPYTLHPTP